MARKGTVAAILDDYQREHGDRVTSSEQIRCAIKHLTAHFGALYPSRIGRATVTAYSERRDAEPGTIRRELGTLKAALGHAVRERRLSPGDKPFIHMPDEPPARDRWLTKAEAEALREAAQWVKDKRQDGLTRVRLFIEIGLATGARRRAIEELRWEQVDLDNKLIRFNPEGRVQTAKRRPTVPISDGLLEWLQWAKAESKTPFVLFDSSGIIRPFNAAVQRAGLKNVVPHTLRHTWATWAAQAGVSIYDIAGILGDHFSTVVQRYAHHDPEHLRSAVNFK
jgi:integrase